MKRFRLSAMAVLLLAFGASALRAGPFSEIVVFGDSLSDTGNVYRMTFGLVPASPPNYSGRFSNGPVWVERLAERLGLPVPGPKLAGGTDYAYGGAETGAGYTQIVVPNLGTQIADYLRNQAPRSDQLFVVWGGGNDLLNDPGLDVAVPASHLSDHVSALAGAGGRHFLVPNLPPLGQTPRYHGTASEAGMDELATGFNNRLAEELADLQTPPATDVFLLDVADMFDRLLAAPARFGFDNVTDQAMGSGQNADRYVFWDAIHPTTAAHLWIGDLAADMVAPPPARAGDLDGDHRVDDADLNLLLSAYRGFEPVGSVAADINGDNRVDDRDVGFLLTHFGQNVSAPVVGPAQVVPEPSAAVLAAIGFVGLLFVARRSFSLAAAFGHNQRKKAHPEFAYVLTPGHGSTGSSSLFGRGGKDAKGPRRNKLYKFYFFGLMV